MEIGKRRRNMNFRKRFKFTGSDFHYAKTQCAGELFENGNKEEEFDDFHYQKEKAGENPNISR